MKRMEEMLQKMQNQLKAKDAQIEKLEKKVVTLNDIQSKKNPSEA